MEALNPSSVTLGRAELSSRLTGGKGLRVSGKELAKLCKAGRGSGSARRTCVARSSFSGYGDQMAPRAQLTAQRGANVDVMGLLLQQRIVFLGDQLDDFVADAIVSQLLLLDAQDERKRIRMFINCAGGPVRCVAWL